MQYNLSSLISLLVTMSGSCLILSVTVTVFKPIE